MQAFKVNLKNKVLAFKENLPMPVRVDDLPARCPSEVSSKPCGRGLMRLVNRGRDCKESSRVASRSSSRFVMTPQKKPDRPRRKIYDLDPDALLNRGIRVCEDSNAILLKQTKLRKFATKPLSDEIRRSEVDPYGLESTAGIR